MAEKERKKFVLNAKEVEIITGEKARYNVRVARLAVEALVGVALLGMGVEAAIEGAGAVNVFTAGGSYLTFDNVKSLIKTYRARKAFEEGSINIISKEDRGRSR